MSAPLLHLTADVRNLRARDARSLHAVDVVAFAELEIELLGRCLHYDDGRHRAVIRPDASRHRAIALRLHFADGRQRLCPATSLCACRCHGLCVVQFDAMNATTRWCFGPDDDQAVARDEEMLDDWQAQKRVVPQPPVEHEHPIDVGMLWKPTGLPTTPTPIWGALGTNVERSEDQPTPRPSGTVARTTEAPVRNTVAPVRATTVSAATNAAAREGGLRNDSQPLQWPGARPTKDATARTEGTPPATDASTRREAMRRGPVALPTPQRPTSSRGVRR